MFETYRPSGRFGALTIPLCIIGTVATVPLAIGYALLLAWIPSIYISIVLTLVAGWLLGLIALYVCRFGHVRNLAIAWLVGLSLPLVFLAAKFIFQWQYSGPGFDFLSFLEARVDQGWNIGRRGQNNRFNGFFVYAVWLIEAGLILYRSHSPAVAQAKEPYSEPLTQWASEQEQVMTLPISDDEMITQIQRRRRLTNCLSFRFRKRIWPPNLRSTPSAASQAKKWRTPISLYL